MKLKGPGQSSGLIGSGFNRVILSLRCSLRPYGGGGRMAHFYSLVRCEFVVSEATVHIRHLLMSRVEETLLIHIGVTVMKVPT